MTILKTLNVKDVKHQPKFKDVPVNEIEEGAKIRIRKMTVSGQMRLSELHKQIDKMNCKSYDVPVLRMTAVLMCVMVDEEGNALMPDDNIVEVKDLLDNTGVLDRLINASNEVNGVKQVTEEVEDLKSTKKNS